MLVNNNRRSVSTYRDIILIVAVTIAFLQCISFYQEHHRSLRLRTLSKMTDHLHAYQHEAPIGAGRGTSMLLGIFSMTGKKYARRRELIRKSYLSGDDRICTLHEYKRQATETPNQRVCQVPYTFVIGAGGDDRPTDHGDDAPLTLDTDRLGGHEDDCTYLNVKENMEDGKSTTYFKYGSHIAKTYGLDFVAKVDDDTAMAMPLLLEFIDDDLPPAPYNRRMYGGSFVPSRELQHIYAQGQFYFMSSDLAEYVGNSLTTQERRDNSLRIEDLDMGTFIHSIERPIKVVDLTSRIFWIHPVKEEKDFVKAVVTRLQTLPHMRQSMIAFKFYCPHWLRGEFHKK